MLLQRVEERNDIVRRWTPTSPEYVSTKAVMRSKSKEKLKKEIRQGARERWYLLRLKSKYAGICLYIYALHNYLVISCM